MRRSRKTRKYKKKRSIRRKKNTMRGGNHTTIKMEHFIERKNKDGPKEISGVPLIIYRTWYSHDIPKRMKDEIDQNMKMTSEFDNYLYSDEDCSNFIKDNFEPDVLKAFNSLKPGAYKADLFRYCILYKKGGIYVDIKVMFESSLLEMLKKHPIIFVKDGILDGDVDQEMYPLWNGLMSSPPENKIFMDCIDEIVESCKNKDYKRNPLDITGPSLLGRMVRKHKGGDYYHTIPFKFTRQLIIYYNDVPFTKEYNGYSEDKQRKNHPHYSAVYAGRNVYANNIKWGGGSHKTDETVCKNVSSRGIMKSCSLYSSNPVSSIKTLEGYDFSKVTDGSTVYITGSAIPAFVNILNNLPGKIILVSGDCDENIPDAVLSSDEFTKFIESDKIIHWFSQNCVKIHPKLSKIPIGLDYHTISNKNGHSWGNKATPKDQENTLIDIKNKSKPFYERKIQCYSNFSDDGSKSDRINARQKISSECIFYEPGHLKRIDTWKKQCDYAFLVSPHGYGLDCHRTWEALYLGCIVIIKKSSIDSLYDDLPVLIVKDWSEVTQELLDSTVFNFKNKKFNYDKLTLKYWMDLIELKK